MPLILVTGMPGVGKTTILRRVSVELTKRNVSIAGFYTEEVRDLQSGGRIGFDVVTFRGQRAPLARVASGNRSEDNPSVGRYFVCLKDFESLAISAMEQRRDIVGTGGLLLLDEIGKMELKSQAFQKEINAIASEVTARKLGLVATIPLKATGIDVVDRLKGIPGCVLFHVTPSNRDQMYEQIRDACVRMVSK